MSAQIVKPHHKEPAAGLEPTKGTNHWDTQSVHTYNRTDDICLM